MRKVFRRCTAILSALCLMLSLAACGSGSSSGNGGSGGSSSSDSSSLTIPSITIKDGVAKAEQIILSDQDFNADGLQLLACEDGWLYGFNYSYEGDGLSGYELVRFRTDGSEFKQIPCLTGKSDMDAETEIAAAAFQDGNFYLGLVTYGNSPALDYQLSLDEDQEIDDDILDSLSEDASTKYEILCVSKDGEEKWRGPVEEPADSDYFYIDSITVSEDGIFLASYDGVDRYSLSDGTFEEHVCQISSDDLTGMLYVLEDGTVLMADDSSGTGMKILRYNSGGKKFEECVTLPSSLYGNSIYPGRNYDLYLAAEDGIYGIDLGSSALSVIVNFVNSDLDAQGVTRILEAEDGKIAVQVYGADVNLETYLLEPVDPKDVKDKKELTLGGYYIDFEVRSQVIQFNKENDTYRITIVDYSQYDSVDDDYDESTGLSRMNTDIVSGNTPDIMILSDYMPVKSYVSKGVFMDLMDLYKADPDIERDDFMQNIVDAFLTDGKMYVAVPGFTVTGIAGKTKYIGDGKDLTIEKAKEIGQSIGLESSQLFGVMDRGSVFSSAIEFSGDQFIDQETHTCDFQNAQFEELLSFVKPFPETLNDEQDQDYYTQFLADKALLGIQYIGSAYDYYFMTRQLYGDVNVTVTGFPSADNKGPSVAANLELGISNSSSEKEGCWSFVRRFLLPEYQMAMQDGLPISRKAIRAQGQAIIDDLKEQQEEYEEYMREVMGGTDDTDGGDEEGLSEDTEEMVDAGEESEDLTGQPVPEEDFDGTHEEYEEYLKEFESESDGSDSEEIVIDPEEIDVSEDVETQYGLASLPDFGESDIEALMSLLDSLSFSVNGEQDVLNIITEEADAYFSGQKSAADVADIIQSRVSVYLKENE